MFRRKKPWCTCALAFAAGILMAFILPLGFIVGMEAVIIIIFGWMLFFRQ